MDGVETNGLLFFNVIEYLGQMVYGIGPAAVSTTKLCDLRADAGDNLAHTVRKTMGEAEGFSREPPS
jgi:hypothetical protein